MIKRITGTIYKSIGNTLLMAGIILFLVSVDLNPHHQKTAPPLNQTHQQNQAAVISEESLSKSDEFLPASGRLIIPSLELELEIGYGVSDEDLKQGPGFYPQSGHPDTGNVCIAGHLNAYGNPFLNLSKMQPDDEIELDYNGRIYKYQVQKVFIVDEYDWSVIDPVGEPVITLTTCHPLYPVNGKYDRLIVRGVQTSVTTKD
ncbi:MAG: class E sortase [Syntrophomonadaceae bacterium]|jgi:sortase A|nr:class E sortase [Syntrophomonadaceae bacterium]